MVEETSTSGSIQRTMLSNAKFEVEKFNGTNNFGMWQCQVQDLLFRERSHIALEAKPKNMSEEDWSLVNRQACGTIRLCLAKEQKYFVMKETSAAQLWKKLEDKYMTKSIENRLYLKKKLFRFQYKKGTPMIEHLDNFNKILADLQNLDVEISDEDMASLLLNSLPESYDHLTTTLLYGKNEVKFSDVSNALVNNEYRRKDLQDHNDTTLEALIASRGRTNNRTNGQEYEKIKAAESILIVGGGPTGVELAAEIATDFPGKKVTLVHRGSRLLEFIGESVSKKALNWLTSKKVEVILGQSVDVNTPSDGVYRTSGGETVAADCYFLCTGTQFGSAWLKETILKDSLDSRGRVMVDSNLTVKGCNNIFAIGDITDVPELKQGYLAQEHAKVVAKNITSLIKGVEDDHKLAVYKPATNALAIVSLGRKDAVAQFPCLSIAGRVQGMIKSGDLFVGKTRKGLGLSPGA